MRELSGNRSPAAREFRIVPAVKHGFLLIDKPVRSTSHDVVAQVRRTLGERNIGHLGTLDPAASGLLVLAVGGKALKLVEFFGDLSKEYVATIRFGARSSTYDREGAIEEVRPKPGWVTPDDSQLQMTIQRHFLGAVQQVPPAHSAVHIDGKRAYELARQGKQVALQPRAVTIEACEVLRYAYPNLALRIACGSGTYIRSLAHDLGERLRCGGYLADLRRTKVGEWSVDFAVKPSAVGWSFVIPLKEVLTEFHGIELTAEEVEDVRHGRDIRRQVKPDTIGWHEDLPVAVLVPARDGTGRAHARKVL